MSIRSLIWKLKSRVEPAGLLFKWLVIVIDFIDTAAVSSKLWLEVSKLTPITSYTRPLDQIGTDLRLMTQHERGLY